MDILCRAFQLSGKPRVGFGGGYLYSRLSAVTGDALLPSWSASCCFFIPADSQWLTPTLLPTLPTSNDPSCLLLFLLFLCQLLNYTVERAQRGGEIIDCFAALCLLCSFSCSPPFCKAGCSEKSHSWQNSLDEGFPVDALLAFSSIRIDSMLQFILTVQRFASWKQVCSWGQYRRTVHERREKIQCLSMNWAETGTFPKVTNVITLN